MSQLSSLSLSLSLSPAPVSRIYYLSHPPRISLLISPLVSLLFHLSLSCLTHSRTSLSPFFYHTSLRSLNISHLSRFSVFSRVYLTSRTSLNIPLLSLLLHLSLFSPITTSASLILFLTKNYIIYKMHYLLWTFSQTHIHTFYWIRLWITYCISYIYLVHLLIID